MKPTQQTERSLGASGLGIRGRAFGALVVIAVLVGLSALAIMGQSQAIVKLSERITQSQQAVNEVLQIAARNSEVNTGLSAYLHTDKEVFKMQYEQAGSRVSAANLARLKNLGYENSAAIKQLTNGAAQLASVDKQALELYAAGKKTEASALRDTDAYRSWQNYFIGSLKEFNAQQSDRILALKDQLQAQWERMVQIYWGSTATILLVSLVLTMILVRAIIRPVMQLERAARALSRGNLEIRIPITSKDELGRLAVAFNKMAVVLNEESMRSHERLEKITKALGEKE